MNFLSNFRHETDINFYILIKMFFRQQLLNRFFNC